MKSKKSITKKLFIITSIVFIVFITTTLIIQSLFFQEFYIRWKKNSLKSNLQKFKVQYNKVNNGETTNNLIITFEEDNNYKVIIQDEFGNLKYITKSMNERKDAMRIRIIQEIINEQLNNTDTINKLKKNYEPIILVTNKKMNMIRDVVGIVYDHSKNETIYALSSLQPVDEAAAVIKEFYYYFYIGAMIIIIILSLIYSNMITKPIIKITKVASKMANLDFTEKCEAKGDDEIGNLADSLNSLSQNLNYALNSMKEYNSKLENDIQRERKLADIRRDFVAAVSHELKTPITLIEGYAQALNDDVLEYDEKQYSIDVILDETKKMGNLVSDMLDLSQLESGSFKLVKEDFYLDDLIKLVTKKFSSIIQEKNIKLELNLIKNIKINADWNRIDQVITNYITNALRHTDNDKLISITMIDKDYNVNVEVINSGNNIPEDNIERIWDNFYKIDKSRNRKLGGSGIGLAIVKNIIFLHEGDFGVENVKGGVKFYFALKKIQ